MGGKDIRTETKQRKKGGTERKGRVKSYEVENEVEVEVENDRVYGSTYK